MIEPTAEELKLYRQAISFLKKNSGVKHSISVKRISLKNLDGLCKFTNNKFIVLISNKLSISHSIDVAIHEIAHAMCWGKEKDKHGDMWGICYSKLYRIFLNDFLNG